MHPGLLRALAPACLALVPLVADASYYSLTRNTKEAQEAIVFDARYPEWTRHIYIATYPGHSRSVEGWTAPYYGGIVSDDRPGAKQLIQFASWQMGGKGAPASGIDFVHAGPHMSWKRSTWEGSSGGIKGLWPADSFKPGQWYRFVHRTWTTPQGTPGLGYAGVWMKSLDTGKWHHLATFKFPARLTGFDAMGGFVEFITGGSSPAARVDFRNSYALRSGRWVSEADFSAFNHKEDTITLEPVEDGAGVRLTTTRTPVDPGTKRHQVVPVATQRTRLKQADTPALLEPAKIGQSEAEVAGSRLVVRWTVPDDSAPQLGYTVKVFSGDTLLTTAEENDPNARLADIPLPKTAAAAPLRVTLALRDIFGGATADAPVSTRRATPLAQAPAPANLTPGLAYRYYSAPKPDTWSALPDFKQLAPARTGTVATLDITPRDRRLGYAFEFDGYLRVPADGLYTFRLTAASGAKLILGDRTVIDADGDRSIARYTGAVALRAGLYPIRLPYYQGKAQLNQADDQLQLAWAGPGFDTTPVPAAAFAHVAPADAPKLTLEGAPVGHARVRLLARPSPGTPAPERIEYYATCDTFDYFAMQGGRSAQFFLGSAKPGEPLETPIWGGAVKTVGARMIFSGNRTVDSAPLRIRTPEAPAVDANGMRLTELEHHLYPMSRSIDGGDITLVGESMGLLTRKHRGDITLTARLADITPDTPGPDGTRLFEAGNRFSGIILRNNDLPRPGEPLGGSDIPFIALMGSSDGATRHCDSTMINGAGNQPSGDVGRASKWFRLTRRGKELSALISKDGVTWKPVKTVTLPKLGEEIEVGFVHYAVPSATPRIHAAKFDHLTIEP